MGHVYDASLGHGSRIRWSMGYVYGGSDGSIGHDKSMGHGSRIRWVIGSRWVNGSWDMKSDPWSTLFLMPT